MLSNSEVSHEKFAAPVPIQFNQNEKLRLPVQRVLMAICQFVLIGFASDSNAAALTVSSEPIAVYDESSVAEWYKGFSGSKEAQVKFACRPVLERRGAFLCSTGTPQVMNAMLIRAGLFADGGFGVKRDNLIEANGKVFDSVNENSFGQTINSIRLEAFFNSVKVQCRINRNVCLTDPEIEFKNQVFEKIKNSMGGEPFAIIAMPTEPGAEPHELIPLLSHESLHAQMFLNKNYRLAVTAYWNTLTPSEQLRIKTALDDAYQGAEETTLIDEFQAYTLMRDGKPTYSMHRRNLLNILLANVKNKKPYQRFF